jgi:glycosyltransferase involved in cell wall biosynthesis
MSARPLVSVVIPTYYRNERLRTALDHVFEQNYSPLEVIIVDDSGNRHAEQVATEFESIQYLSLSENCGPNIARTKGIQEASGKYIQLLDDDDLIFKSKINSQVSIFEQNEELIVVYSGGVYESGEFFLPATDARGEVLEQALTFDLPACITSSMLIRREPLLTVMPLPDPPGSDDTYLKIELAQLGPFDFVQEPLMMKGEDLNSRSYSIGAVDGTYQILSSYDDLYERFPSHVQKKAKAAAHYRKGKYLLQNRVWSSKAISAIWRACQTYPGVQKKYWAMFLFSLFGRAGFLTQRSMKEWIRRQQNEFDR